MIICRSRPDLWADMHPSLNINGCPSTIGGRSCLANDAFTDLDASRGCAGTAIKGRRFDSHNGTSNRDNCRIRARRCICADILRNNRGCMCPPNWLFRWSWRSICYDRGSNRAPAREIDGHNDFAASCLKLVEFEKAKREVV